MIKIYVDGVPGVDYAEVELVRDFRTGEKVRIAEKMIGIIESGTLELIPEVTKVTLFTKDGFPMQTLRRNAR